MGNKLPCYQLHIDESVESELEVSYVALVDKPAIEKNFFAFSDDVKPFDFATINDEQRIVVGPAMIPNMLIYRRDDDLGEYNVLFTPETVGAMAEKFFKKGFQNNVNLMHDPSQRKDGVVFFLSFIRNTEMGLVGVKGEYPEGTWFLGAKVNNEEVWNKVKSGEIKGFSLEGIFKYKKQAFQREPINVDQFFEQMIALVEKIPDQI